MTEFRKYKEQGQAGFYFTIVEYWESDNHEEEMKDWKAKSDMMMRRGPAPITGGPVIGLFYREQDADEYLKFKNGK